MTVELDALGFIWLPKCAKHNTGVRSHLESCDVMSLASEN